MREALASLGVDLDVIAELEPDAALGNGGLGRLAACFMESMATVDIPAYGYGIRYVNGMFRQEIQDGWQVELPETWLDAWQSLGIRAPRERLRGRLRRRGRVGRHRATAGSNVIVWKPTEHVLAVAYDTPVVGWRGKRVNTLRLWSGHADRPDPARRLQCRRPHRRAAREQQGRQRCRACSIRPMPRRPGRSCGCGRSIFFSSASLQDILRRHLQPVWRSDVAAGQGRDPAQRHASGGCRRRTDAPADDVHGLEFDAGLGHHQAAPSPTPTTRCCPRRWKAGRCRCSSGCCRATCRSSMPSMPRSCSRRAANRRFDDEQIAASR